MNYLKKLSRAGIESLDELLKLNPSDLIKDYRFTRSEINDMNDTLGMYKSCKPVTVYDLIKENEKRLEHFSTLSKGIDAILGGGVLLTFVYIL